MKLVLLIIIVLLAFVLGYKVSSLANGHGIPKVGNLIHVCYANENLYFIEFDSPEIKDETCNLKSIRLNVIHAKE